MLNEYVKMQYNALEYVSWNTLINRYTEITQLFKWKTLNQTFYTRMIKYLRMLFDSFNKGNK